MTLLKRQLSEEHRQNLSKALKGNQNAKGYHHSDETKRRMNKSRKGRKLSEEHKKNLSKALKGNQNRKDTYHSKETRKKMSESRKGRSCSKETRRRISESLKGGHPSEETKKKISESLKGGQFSEETKQKMVEAHRNPQGVCQSEEYKQRTRTQRLNQKFLRRDTSIEVALQNELSGRGMNYETHLTVCGICQPDIVFPKLKIAVFADGDYWHSPAFDDGKTWRRDRNQDMVLKERGWQVQRFWGHEIRKDTKGCVDKIVGEIRRFNG